MPGRGDRCDRALHARVERERRRTYETSRRTDELVAHARRRAADFLGCSDEEVAFGPSMTSLNFLLTRALGAPLRREKSPRHPARPRRQRRAVARARSTTSASSSASWTSRRPLARLRRPRAQLSERTRVVAFPIAANSVGTLPTCARIVELAHAAGALAWADAVHYGPHGPSTSRRWDVDVLVCSPYKFFGPHMGLAFGKRDFLASWRPYKVRPAADEPVGTASSSARCSTSCSPASSPQSTTSTRSAGTRSPRTSARSGSDSSTVSPTTCSSTACRRWKAACRRSASTVAGLSSEEVPSRSCRERVAVWWGNYYALETMKQLGLERTPAPSARASSTTTRGRGRPAPRRRLTSS